MTLRPLHLALCAAAALPLANARAAELTTLTALTQDEFKLLSEDLAAALSFKPLIPSEALGMPGFDIGIALSGTNLKSPTLLSKAAANASVPTVLPVPSLRAHIGLPLSIDIGLMYAQVPDVKMTLIGGELRWAVIAGSTAVPAVALRGAFTQLQGVDQLKIDTMSVDVSVSKGFLLFTPYGGVGQVWTTSTPDSSLVPNLIEEKVSQFKVFAGVNVNLGFNMAFEVDSTGGIVSLSLKGGLRF